MTATPERVGASAVAADVTPCEPAGAPDQPPERTAATAHNIGSEQEYRSAGRSSEAAEHVAMASQDHFLGDNSADRRQRSSVGPQWDSLSPDHAPLHPRL